MHDPTRRFPSLSRRHVIRTGIAAAGTLFVGRDALGATRAPRALDLYAINTGERVRAAYAEQGRYQPDALTAISRLLRDIRTGEMHPIDPALLDLVHRLCDRVGRRPEVHVICGYRSPATNARRRAAGHRVARNSFHMHGKALDLRIPGVSTAQLRRAARGLGLGGVGYYPRSGFVHVDTGPVRTW